MGKYRYRHYLYLDEEHPSSKTWRSQCPIYLENKCSASVYGCVGKDHCAKYQEKCRQSPLQKEFKEESVSKHKKVNKTLKNSQKTKKKATINKNGSNGIIVEINMKKSLLTKMVEKCLTQGFYNLRGFGTDLTTHFSTKDAWVKELIIKAGNEAYQCYFKYNKQHAIFSGNIATLYFEIKSMERIDSYKKYKCIGKCYDEFYGTIIFRKYN